MASTPQTLAMPQTLTAKIKPARAILEIAPLLCHRPLRTRSLSTKYALALKRKRGGTRKRPLCSPTRNGLFITPGLEAEQLGEMS